MKTKPFTVDYVQEFERFEKMNAQDIASFELESRQAIEGLIHQSRRESNKRKMMELQSRIDRKIADARGL